MGLQINTNISALNALRNLPSYERNRFERGLSRRGRALKRSWRRLNVWGWAESSSAGSAVGSISADLPLADGRVPRRGVQAAWSPRVSRRMTAVL